MVKRKPYISVLIPCFNEEKYIEQCLDSLLDDFVVNNTEFLVIDGGSTDGTREIIKKFIKNYKNADIRLLDNPKRHQSYGLNIGLDRSIGEIIMRVDAHARYPSDYVKRCVGLLKSTGAASVGGAVRTKGNTRFQKLVAIAMRHPAGVGDSRFRLGRFSGYVDTVPFGTFWKNIFSKLGYFDPYTNQDAEFNLRILKSGGKIYLDSSIMIDLFPRDSLKELIRQYFYYGKGRSRTTLKHRQFTSLRQLAPIVLVLGILASFLLSMVVSPVFLLFPAFYVSFILFVSFLAFWRGEMRKFVDVFLLSVIFMSMHISWGLGFLARLFRLIK